MLVVYAAALYLAVGLAVAIGFVTVGVGRCMGASVTLTPAARLLILPGAALLWPLILIRWMRGGGPT